MRNLPVALAVVSGADEFDGGLVRRDEHAQMAGVAKDGAGLVAVFGCKRRGSEIRAIPT